MSAANPQFVRSGSSLRSTPATLKFRPDKALVLRHALQIGLHQSLNRPKLGFHHDFCMDLGINGPSQTPILIALA